MLERKRERFRNDEVDHERQREDCRERERVDHEQERVDEKDVTTFLLLLSVEYKRRRRERERKRQYRVSRCFHASPY